MRYVKFLKIKVLFCNGVQCDTCFLERLLRHMYGLQCDTCILGRLLRRIAAGRGVGRMLDLATERPTLILRSRGEPRIYRHHKATRAPVPRLPMRRRRRESRASNTIGGDAGKRVGLWSRTGHSRSQFGGAKIWRHKCHLASAGMGVDRNLMNEDHHSTSQDSFVWRISSVPLH